MGEDGDGGDGDAQPLAGAVVVKVLGAEDGVGFLQSPEDLEQSAADIGAANLQRKKII